MEYREATKEITVTLTLTVSSDVNHARATRIRDTLRLYAKDMLFVRDAKANLEGK